MSRSFFVFSAFALGLCLLAADVAQAQGGRGRGGPGRGGFQRGGGGGASSLLMREEVQKELDLSDDQIEEIKEQIEEYQEERNESRRDMFEKMRELRELPEDERREAFEEIMSESREKQQKFDSGLTKVLVGDQKDRFSQIKLQMETRVRGNDPIEQAKALLRNPTIQKELGIDEDQAADIEENEKAKDVAKEVQEEVAKVMSDGTDKILLEFLSKKQLAKLKDLMGKKVVIQEQRRGGFQGRGGQDRGGRGGQDRGGRGRGQQRPDSENDF